MDRFDVIVVGRGMIGSAAARHLAEAGHRVALVGPDEADDRRSSAGPFSSHPDEGRVTRLAGRTAVWAQLAARSIDRYTDIERRSGVGFYTPNALAVVVEKLDEWVSSGRRVGSDIREVDRTWLRTRTGVEVAAGRRIGYEGPPAGHINPRRLVEAQTRLAEMAGAQVVRAAAGQIALGDGRFAVRGSFGELAGTRVLLATGAFGTELLDAGLRIERRARTVVMAETDDPCGVPSLIMSDPPDDRLDEVYWVPPVMYPDGRRCLKIGGDLSADCRIGPEELTEWFHGDGNPDETEALTAALTALLPDVAFRSFTSSPCVVSVTPSGHPYVGWVSEGLAVAIGGNGAAAKSSDELGHLAASLFSNAGWDDDYDATAFTPQFA